MDRPEFWWGYFVGMTVLFFVNCCAAGVRAYREWKDEQRPIDLEPCEGGDRV